MCLLMGGPACVLYGGAEFSRDIDFALLAEPGNLGRLQAVLNELQAERIAVPPFQQQYLDLGLAVHFRCRHPDANDIRIDVMSRMRGVAPFQELWNRRNTIDLGGEAIELLSLPDLVQAKKIQRDKDWPMIARLVKVNYLAHRGKATAVQRGFWFRELRTPELIVELVQAKPDEAQLQATHRPLLALAVAGDVTGLRAALRVEEHVEREADRVYWKPLRAELERLRRKREANPSNYFAAVCVSTFGASKVAMDWPFSPFQMRNTLSAPPATITFPSELASAEYMKSVDPGKSRMLPPLVALISRTILSPLHTITASPSATKRIEGISFVKPCTVRAWSPVSVFQTFTTLSAPLLASSRPSARQATPST
jgi:hypothetical protein